MNLKKIEVKETPFLAEKEGVKDRILRRREH